MMLKYPKLEDRINTLFPGVRGFNNAKMKARQNRKQQFKKAGKCYWELESQGDYLTQRRLQANEYKNYLWLVVCRLHDDCELPDNTELRNMDFNAAVVTLAKVERRHCWAGSRPNRF